MTRDDLERAIDERRFGRKDVNQRLDSLTIREVAAILGEADSRSVDYAAPQGNWKPGDGRPGLADEDPAVMAGIGRCAANRTRWPLGSRPLDLGAIHPRDCVWCDMPLDELLKALDWFTWWSRLVVGDALSWRGTNNTVYTRSEPVGYYANPRVRDFAELALDEQTRRVLRVVEASAA